MRGKVETSKEKMQRQSQRKCGRESRDRGERLTATDRQTDKQIEQRLRLRVRENKQQARTEGEREMQEDRWTGQTDGQGKQTDREEGTMTYLWKRQTVRQPNRQ